MESTRTRGIGERREVLIGGRHLKRGIEGRTLARGVGGKQWGEALLQRGESN